MTVVNGKGAGWLPDHPSVRDYALSSEEVQGLFSKLGITTVSSIKNREQGEVPYSKSDCLRQYCSQVESQAKLGSCTANAGIGMVGVF